MLNLIAKTLNLPYTFSVILWSLKLFNLKMFVFIRKQYLVCKHT